MNLRRRITRSIGALALLAVGACGIGSASLCEAPVSLAGFVVGFNQGLENLDSDQSAGLLPETFAASSQARLIADDEVVDAQTRAAAAEFADLLENFYAVMEDALWDVPTALSVPANVSLVARIGSPETLAVANSLESLVIERCGLPPLIPTDSDVLPTLPAPSIAPPTATDPPTNTVNEKSEARAVGTTVGELFGLTLTDSDTICLGEALAGVYDVTGGASTEAAYQRQFQSAFDRCGVDFAVPEG